MPFGFHIYHDVGLMFIRESGAVRRFERLRAIRAWLQDPEYKDCIDAMFDVTHADSPPTLEELREIVAILKKEKLAAGPQKLAIVASNNSKIVIFAGVFDELVQLERVPLAVKVFLDREGAWSWLRPGQPAVEPR
jgi:hypothetical protein